MVQIQIKVIKPLYYATFHHHTNVVAILLKNGADPNFCYKNRTLLYLAISRKSKDITKILLENGANPKFANKWRWNDIVELLKLYSKKY